MGISIMLSLTFYGNPYTGKMTSLYWRRSGFWVVLEEPILTNTSLNKMDGIV